MRTRYAVVLMLLLGSVLVWAQEEQPAEQELQEHPIRATLQQGAYYIAGFTSGSAALAGANIKTNAGDQASLGFRVINLNVSGGYLVADRIGVGPDIRVGFSRVIDPSDNSDTVFDLSLGVHGIYLWERTGSPWVPTGRLGIAYDRKVEKSDGAVRDSIENGFSISPRIGVHYFFTNRVAGAIESAYSLSRKKTDDGDTTITGHTFGFAFGIAVFVR